MNNSEDNAEETKAAHSFVSFSFEKETKEPCHPPLLSLGDDMMDPDPEEGLGGKGGEKGDGGNRDADDDDEEKPRGPSSPFPWRRRRMSPGLLLTCIFRR